MWEKGFIIENDKSGRNTIEKEMISYIQQNFMEKISLKEFSEQFHLSEKYISRYFKEHFLILPGYPLLSNHIPGLFFSIF